MTKVLEEAAWKELSSEFAWNEQLLEKYKDKVVWKEISDNGNILWTVSMIEKFKSKVDWEELSGSDNEHLFTVENLERYKDYWNWSKLSGNSSVELTPVLLEQFADYWDWNESSTAIAGMNCIAWSSWRNTRIIFRHPPYSVPAYGTSWLKTRRNN